MGITAAETSDDFALAALAGWLRGDPDVRRQATVTERASGAAPGVVEVIDIGLAHTEAVTSVLRSYAAWRHRRRDAPAVTVRVRGVPVRIESAAPEAVAWIEALLVADPAAAAR
jgi:hypothetical protein